MRGRAAGAGLLVLAGALVAPSTAAGHGLVGKQDLPIPPELFAGAAAAVLVVSFVLLGHWPAVAGLLGFAWLELVYSGRDDPSTLAVLALAYAAVQLAGMALYGIEPWTDRGDSFSVYFGLFARLSVWERRQGSLWFRAPLAGSTRLEVLPGTVLLL